MAQMQRPTRTVICPWEIIINDQLSEVACRTGRASLQCATTTCRTRRRRRRRHRVAAGAAPVLLDASASINHRCECVCVCVHRRRRRRKAVVRIIYRSESIFSTSVDDDERGSSIFAEHRRCGAESGVRKVRRTQCASVPHPIALINIINHDSMHAAKHDFRTHTHTHKRGTPGPRDLLGIDCRALRQGLASISSIRK